MPTDRRRAATLDGRHHLQLVKVCPALAERHVDPWSRKISVTFSAGRGIAAGG
jgi:hypothetical protein